jgi:hypothetical protein
VVERAATGARSEPAVTIISFEHRFIFIKTRKVAGTSVEAALRTVTGPDDVVTPTDPRDEQYCAANGWTSRNYAYDPDAEARYTELVLAGRLDAAAEFNRALRKRYDGHMRAREIRRRLGRQRFAGFYRFSIERNPFTWLVSIAAYDKAAYRDGSLTAMDVEEIRSRIRTRLRRRSDKWTNRAYYCIGRKLAVDRLIAYERLEADLSQVLDELGIGLEVEIPRLKANPQELATAEIITPELEAEIRERFADVFERMGYAPQLARSAGG